MGFVFWDRERIEGTKGMENVIRARGRRVEDAEFLAGTYDMRTRVWAPFFWLLCKITTQKHCYTVSGVNDQKVEKGGNFHATWARFERTLPKEQDF